MTVVSVGEIMEHTHAHKNDITKGIHASTRKKFVISPDDTLSDNRCASLNTQKIRFGYDSTIPLSFFFSPISNQYTSSFSIPRAMIWSGHQTRNPIE
jgi:hypothetical protein